MATTKTPRTRAKAGTSTQAMQAAQASSASAASTESTLYVNSVEKAMKVLTAFDGSKRHLSLSEIASATGFDISAAQRFTFTLSALGYLLKDPQSKKYELSPKLLDFTYHYLVSNELVSRAAPYLQQLAAETEEATNLTVRLDTDIVFVLRIVSRSVFNANVIVGSRLPAYCTAPGLAMLATLDDTEIDDILARTNLVQFTPATVSQPRKIKERLARIRKQGYSHTEDEFFMGDISTAAAVVNQDGRAIGAINIAVPRVRWNAERDERRFADLVIQTAGALSARRRQEM